MRPQDVEKLLGGYATGTLTEQERNALFQAALSNQDLFNALADEEALKELLDDPDSRRQLLSALEGAKPSFWRQFTMWLGRPAAWAVAGGVAAVVLVAVLTIRLTGPAAKQDVMLEARRSASATPEMTPAAEPKPSPPSSSTAALKGQPEGKKQALRDEDKLRAAAEKVEGSASEVRNRQAAASKDLPAQAEMEAPQPTAAGGGGSAGGRLNVPSKSPEEAPKAEAAAAEVATARPVIAQSPPPPPPAAEVAGSARQLYYIPQQKSDTAFRLAPAPAALRKSKTAEADVGRTGALALGVRYSILRGGDIGTSTEVDPNTIFRTGDLIRLSVEPNESGYLYVMLHKTSGAWKVLFRNRVEQRTKYSIPVSGPVKLGEPAGELKFLVMLSRRPALEFGTEAKVVRAADEEAQVAQLDNIARNLRSDVAGRELLKETVNESTADQRNKEAVYVVDPRPEPDSRVVVEIPVKYQ